eukprot:CAMPEP_0175061852 /NCGR_PEP_ID=MMETSP0052_2-20121109/13823_1 /TAXON_ID=51329 ORGANISM="Polytomella parva, Strain SAG 63-3" /NCGR_SAMPLE_ID=MMETSP0052_2 /ASSEMBLY_ACC=CAM_ASM_000194 /LENGTH=601 /DNA_ID=CAMNT_0016327769 /DNA_START=342 /DNA_END=2143 /DNA_ORIENTATION=-
MDYSNPNTNNFGSNFNPNFVNNAVFDTSFLQNQLYHQPYLGPYNNHSSSYQVGANGLETLEQSSLGFLPRNPSGFPSGLPSYPTFNNNNLPNVFLPDLHSHARVSHCEPFSAPKPSYLPASLVFDAESTKEQSVSPGSSPSNDALSGSLAMEEFNLKPNNSGRDDTNAALQRKRRVSKVKSAQKELNRLNNLFSQLQVENKQLKLKVLLLENALPKADAMIEFMHYKKSQDKRVCTIHTESLANSFGSECALFSVVTGGFKHLAEHYKDCDVSKHLQALNQNMDRVKTLSLSIFKPLPHGWPNYEEMRAIEELTVDEFCVIYNKLIMESALALAHDEIREKCGYEQRKKSADKILAGRGQNVDEFPLSRSNNGGSKGAKKTVTLSSPVRRDRSRYSRHGEQDTQSGCRRGGSTSSDESQALSQEMIPHFSVLLHFLSKMSFLNMDLVCALKNLNVVTKAPYEDNDDRWDAVIEGVGLTNDQIALAVAASEYSLTKITQCDPQANAIIQQIKSKLQILQEISHFNSISLSDASHSKDNKHNTADANGRLNRDASVSSMATRAELSGASQGEREASHRFASSSLSSLSAAGQSRETRKREEEG